MPGHSVFQSKVSDVSYHVAVVEAAVAVMTGAREQRVAEIVRRAPNAVFVGCRPRDPRRINVSKVAFVRLRQELAVPNTALLNGIGRP
jgi:hypothetical protein